MPGPVPSALRSRPRPVVGSGPRCACLTCRVVLWSEKGELKNVVTMLMTISVTYFSKTESACFRSLVLLQAWGAKGSVGRYSEACTSAVAVPAARP